MVSGREVAKLAGTSVAVVSYVFNNGPRNVAPATRDRVLRAAEQLSYRPNALARALSHGKTSSVGLIVPDIANRYFGELARALADSAARRRHTLLIGDSGLLQSRESAHIDDMVARRIDGLVMVSLEDEPDLTPLLRAGIPVAMLQPMSRNANVSCISTDFTAAAHDAVTHLLSHGYRSITLLNRPADSAGVRMHREGFLSAIAQSKFRVEVTELRSEISRGDAAAVIERAFTGSRHSRAVYCTTDEQAVGVIFACHRLELAVPDDVAIMGFDGTEHSAYSLPPLSTVSQSIPRMTERAVEVILGPTTASSVREDEPYELVIRKSCGTHR